jgi:hypothetical protein
MKLNCYIIFAVIILLSVVSAASAEHAKSALQQMDLRAYPGSSIVTESNLPTGRLLDELTKDAAPWLGLEELKQISLVVLGIDSSTSADDIWKFYGPALDEQQWKIMVRNFQNSEGVAVLYNENEGMLIMDIDPATEKDREMTLLRIFSKVDPSKMGDPSQKLPDFLEKMVSSALGPNGNGGDVQSASRIPIGQPIAVPPAGKLHIKCTRSQVRACILDQNTAEIKLTSPTDDPGELVRIDDRLVLALTPKLGIDEIILPGTMPVLLEITEGSLMLTGGSGIVRLSVISTGAPVTIEMFPLTSGCHMVKSVGGDVLMTLSSVKGGSLDVEVTGANLTLTLLREASAKVNVSAPSGKIQNFVTSDQPSGDQLSFQIGAGDANISLKSVGGTVCLKTAE